MAEHLETPEIVDPIEEELDTDMLDAAREAYTYRLPPFIQREITCSPGHRLKVTLAPEFHQSPTIPLTELICRSWDRKNRYWTLDDHGLRHIVKGFKAVDSPNMIAFHIWLGMDVGFGVLTAVLLKRNDMAFVSAFDVSKDLATRQASVPAAPKRKRRVPEPECEDKTRRIRRRLQYEPLPKATKHTPLRYPHPLTKIPNSSMQTAAPATHARAKTPLAQPPLTCPTPANPSATPAITTKNPNPPGTAPLSLHKSILENTRLHICPSHNSHGTITVYLASCPTIELFHSTILAALQVPERDLEAITLRCDWMADGAGNSMVVVKELPDTYRYFLECVREAPCWMEGNGGRKRCEVRVLVILKGR